MALDPKAKYLIQEGSGAIYLHTDKLAKRKDMKPYNPETGGRVIEPNEATKRLVEIELKGKSFLVAPDLHDVLTEMGGVMVALQEENAALKDKTADFDAERERLTTDIQDLMEQLEAVREQMRLGTTVVDTGSDGVKAAEPATEKNKKGK